MLSSKIYKLFKQVAGTFFDHRFYISNGRNAFQIDGHFTYEDWVWFCEDFDYNRDFEIQITFKGCMLEYSVCQIVSPEVIHRYQDSDDLYKMISRQVYSMLSNLLAKRYSDATTF